MKLKIAYEIYQENLNSCLLTLRGGIFPRNTNLFSVAKMQVCFRFLKSKMHPTAQHRRSISGQQSSLDKERNHARADQLLQRGVIASAKRVS